MNKNISDIKIKIPDVVKMIIDKLNKNNYESVIVGGCVRDSIIGIEPHDWDIATSAEPEKVRELFKEYNLMLAGLKHGTVTVIINHIPYEITTYRIDGKYTDFRRPDDVLFTSDLKDDIMRRDFTINAIAYDGNNIIDYCNGINDLNNGIIRCVGNADDRLQEDPLRIMRAIRFAARFKFIIEDDTFSSMYKNKDLLKKIAIERKQNEFTKTIMCKDADIIKQCKPFFEYVLPILRHVDNNKWCEIISTTNNSNDLCEKLSIIVDGLEYKDYNRIVKVLSQDMKYPNRIVKTVCNILSGKDMMITDSNICAKQLLYKYTLEDVIHILKYKEAKIMYDANKKDILNVLNNMEVIVKNVADGGECYNIKGMSVNGRDLKDLGVEDVKIKNCMESLLNLIVTGQVDNTKNELIKVVKIYIL